MTVPYPIRKKRDNKIPESKKRLEGKINSFIRRLMRHNQKHDNPASTTIRHAKEKMSRKDALIVVSLFKCPNAEAIFLSVNQQQCEIVRWYIYVPFIIKRGVARELNYFCKCSSARRLLNLISFCKCKASSINVYNLKFACYEIIQLLHMLKDKI